MISSYSIIWSPRAKITFANTLEYLNEEWTIKEIAAFIERTEIVLQHISNNPLLYSYSKAADVHKCVVVKQVSLFYRVRADHIELLVFWDNRQNPERLLL